MLKKLNMKPVPPRIQFQCNACKLLIEKFDKLEKIMEELKNRLEKLEDEDKDINCKLLPIPSDDILNDFHSHMKEIDSFDNIELFTH